MVEMMAANMIRVIRTAGTGADCLIPAWMGVYVGAGPH